MAFESLTNKLNMSLRRFLKRDYLTENDIDDMMREVRLSLLEADVNILVVDSFIEDVKKASLGEKIMKGLNPGEQVVKIVSDCLTKYLGSEQSALDLSHPLSVIMLIGLQGAGKTTHAAKLAKYISKNYSKSVMLAACDTYRPGAKDQLIELGSKIDTFVFSEDKQSPVEIAKDALEYAKYNNYQVLIIDTQGRLSIDTVLIDELKEMKKVLSPSEVLLTVDSLMGQEAANVASTFNKEVGITGAILTKLDGDERGGACLSVKKVTGVPIKFSGVGEKVDDIEIFYPDRIASRILGMGDILTLVEKTEEEMDEKEQEKLMEKIQNGTYDYNDLLKQMKLIKRLGSLSGLLKMLPGMSQLSGQIDDKQLDFIQVVINSMTKEERKNPELIERSSSRKRRIAAGSGRSVTDVSKLEQMLQKQKEAFKRLAGFDESKMMSVLEKFGMGSTLDLEELMKNRGNGRF